MMKTRKSIFLGLFLAVTLCTIGCAPDAVDSNGRPIRIADYQGRWVVINYWATWCNPCIQEIPALIKLRTYYRDKVIVLGVNVDNLSDPVLNNLAEGYQVNYPFLNHFPIERWGGKNSSDIPVTYIIDPKGKLYQTLKGPQNLQNFQSVMNLPDIVYP